MTETSNPTHIAYSVRNFDKHGQSQASWTRVGVAPAHKDGEGFDVNLESVPFPTASCCASTSRVRHWSRSREARREEAGARHRTRRQPSVRGRPVSQRTFRRFGPIIPPAGRGWSIRE